MSGKRIVLLFILMGVLVGIILLLNTPTTSYGSVLNTGETGISILYAMFGPEIATDLGEIEGAWSNSTVAILVSDKPLSKDTYVKISNLAEKGGMVIYAGDYDSISVFLKEVGLDDAVVAERIYDPIVNSGGDKRRVIAISSYGTSLVLEPSYYFNPHHSKLMWVANSSQYSFVDTNGNGFYDIGEPIGSYVVVALIRIGKGGVLLISDPGVFTNKHVWENYAFLRNITSSASKIVIIQTPDALENNIDYLKISLHKYGVNRLLPLIIALIIVIGVWYAMEGE